MPEVEGGDEDKELKKAIAKRLKELQIEEQKKTIVRQYLEPEAYERLMNVRVSNYDLYVQLLDLIISMAQTNRLPGRITEKQLIDLLAKLTARPEPKIEFKHK
ncbi:MAG: DNA-binding protein [Candidatus Micrarchaeota archaeon]